MKNSIKKIAFLYEFIHPKAIAEEIENVRSYDLDIKGFNLHNYFAKWSFVQFEFLYSFKDKDLYRAVEDLKRDLSEFDTIIIYGTLYLTPRLVFENLRDKNIIFWATDDPVSSTISTAPYLTVADLVLTQSPMLDETRSHPEYITEWSGVPCLYQQLGYLPAWLEGISEERIIHGKRNIDVSFVGSPAWRKDLLLACKKRFGRRFKIYSRDWNFLKHLYYDFIKNGVFHYVPRAQNESEVYVRSKSSIHISCLGGPSSSRIWHVPICGATLLSDQKLGLKQIFTEQDTVVPFEFMSEDDLISKIDWTLSNEKEAREIGINGYFYTKNHLRFSKLLAEKINFIQETF